VTILEELRQGEHLKEQTKMVISENKKYKQKGKLKNMLNQV